MTITRTFTRSFAGGEVTPEFWGMINDVHYQNGLATCRNFITLPHGPVQNRTGTARVLETKDSTRRSRLIPFIYSSDLAYVLEFGHNYIRIHTLGGTILSAGIPYEIATTYTEDEIFDIRYVQSSAVLTITHSNHAPAELHCIAAANWTLADISFISSVYPPTGIVTTPTLGTGTPNLQTYYYIITSLNSFGLDESIAGVETSGVNDLFLDGAYNTIAWSAGANASRYNIYRKYRGLFGYVGQTDGLSFKDDNIAPDLSKTPPISANPFSGSNNYPRACTYYQQRRIFAATNNKPQTTWATRTGSDTSLTYSLPTRADDSIEFTLKGRRASIIQHLVPFTTLLEMTTEGEWAAEFTDGIATVNPQSYIGSNNVQPVVVNSNILYATQSGGHVRELGYSFQQNGFITGDLCLRAPHMFDNLEVEDMTFSKSPYPIVWSISSNGHLLGFTYIPEQQLGAWHRHDTLKGAFESVCVIPENGKDILYAVVKRTLGSQVIRMVEYFKPRETDNQDNCFFVDCGATYEGAPASTISGLDWLEGEEVSILANGAVHARRTVQLGEIELDYEAYTVHVGLPITADIQTLPVVMENIPGAGQGRYKNINKAWLRVYRSSGIFVGPSLTTLVEHKQRTTESLGEPPALKTEEIELMLKPDWTTSGQIYIRQSDPLPLTVCSLTLEVVLGG